jgi:hypothetical protein
MESAEGQHSAVGATTSAGVSSRRAPGRGAGATGDGPGDQYDASSAGSACAVPQGPQKGAEKRKARDADAHVPADDSAEQSPAKRHADSSLVAVGGGRGALGLGPAFAEPVSGDALAQGEVSIDALLRSGAFGWAGLGAAGVAVPTLGSYPSPSASCALPLGPAGSRGDGGMAMAMVGWAPWALRPGSQALGLGRAVVGDGQGAPGAVLEIGTATHGGGGWQLSGMRGVGGVDRSIGSVGGVGMGGQIMAGLGGSGRGQGRQGRPVVELTSRLMNTYTRVNDACNSRHLHVAPPATTLPGLPGAGTGVGLGARAEAGVGRGAGGGGVGAVCGGAARRVYNHGYDDENGNYIVRVGDVVNGRYQIALKHQGNSALLGMQNCLRGCVCVCVCVCVWEWVCVRARVRA